jgi:type IV secretion system protein TrbL
MTWNVSWARRGLTAAILIGGMVLLGSSASADQGSALDQITTTYRNATLSWQSSLLAHAKALFALLAGIEVIYSMCRLVVRGGELQDFVYELFQQIMYIGFFGWLLTNYSTFTGYIIQSFEQAGATASQSAGGAGGLTPGDTFSAGLQVCTLILQIPAGPGGLDALAEVPNKIGLLLLAVVILICFVLIAAEQILTLVESYIVVAAGMLMMGFGGSRWTKDYAIKTFGYSLSVGAKLMILNLVIGLGLTLIKQWAGSINSSSTLQSAFVMLGQAVVMLALTKSIPQMVHGLVSGGLGHGSGAMERAAGQIAAAVGGAVATAAGVGMATSAASSLASEQLKNSDDNGAGPKGGLGQMLGHIGKTAQNLGDGAAEDIGNRLSGKPGANSGVMGGRIAANLGHHLQQIGAAAAKPAAPGGPGSAGSGAPGPGATGLGSEAANAAESKAGSGKLEGELASDADQTGKAEQTPSAEAPADAVSDPQHTSGLPAVAPSADALGANPAIGGSVEARAALVDGPAVGTGAGDAGTASLGGSASPGAAVGVGDGATARGVSEAPLGFGEGGAAGASAAVAAGDAAAVGAVLIDGGVKGAGWTGSDGQGADASGLPPGGEPMAGLEVGRFGSSAPIAFGPDGSPQSAAVGLVSETTTGSARPGATASPLPGSEEPRSGEPSFGAPGFESHESGEQALGVQSLGLTPCGFIASGTDAALVPIEPMTAHQGGALEVQAEPSGLGPSATVGLGSMAGSVASGLASAGYANALDGSGSHDPGRSIADSASIDAGLAGAAEAPGAIPSPLADTPATATPVANATTTSLAEDARVDAASLASETPPPFTTPAGGLGSAVPSATGPSATVSPSVAASADTAAAPITMAPTSTTAAASASAASVGATSPVSASLGLGVAAAPSLGSLTPSAAQGPSSPESVVTGGLGGGLGGALAAPLGATPVVSAGGLSIQPQHAPEPPISPPVSGPIAGHLGPTSKGSS